MICLWRMLGQPCYLARYLGALLLLAGESTLIMLAPLLMRRIMRFIENEEEPAWHGYAYASVMFLRKGESCPSIS